MAEPLYDAVIVGGGAIGCATAWELARRGHAVAVVERGVPGRGATRAAAGMLSPLAESGAAGPFLELGLESLARYPALAESLREATGLDVEYRTRGKLVVALDGEGERALAESAAWQRSAGHAAEWLDRAALRELEPAIAPAARAGLWIALDHQVDNRRLGRALWVAAAGAGVHFHLGEPVAGLRRAGRRATGVALASGGTLSAGAVVLAAGCWSGGTGGLPRPLPVTPVRGQMIAVRAVPPLLSRVVATAGCYLVPRASGRLLIGATAERVGFHRRTTAAGIRSLLTAAIEAVPTLAEAPIVETWAGLRPGTPDGLPILGPEPELDGLFYATGHYRAGILLTPITATLLAEAVSGDATTLPLEPFAVTRFPATVPG